MTVPIPITFILIVMAILSFVYVIIQFATYEEAAFRKLRTSIGIGCIPIFVYMAVQNYDASCNEETAQQVNENLHGVWKEMYWQLGQLNHNATKMLALESVANQESVEKVSPVGAQMIMFRFNFSNRDSKEYRDNLWNKLHETMAKHVRIYPQEKK